MTSGNNGNENRRGSSIFAASAAEEGDVSGPYGRPAYLYGRNDGHEQLLVDFPDQTMGGNHYPQQQQQGPGVGYPPQQGNHGPSAATGPNPNSLINHMRRILVSRDAVKRHEWRNLLTRRIY